MAEPETHRHDAYVSYVDADRSWVAGVLFDAFERAQVHYIHEAGFSLGVPRLANFQEAVTSSARTVLVISPAYLADGLSRFVEILAQTYGVDTGTWPVIPLRHGVTGDELPLLLKSIEGLDAADPDAIERLCAELKRPLPPPPPRPACPYPGMRPYGLDSDGNPSHPFFGRDDEVEDLLQRLRRHPFLAVIGASGSGKSSLVFAGLVPALRRSGLFGEGSWLVRSCRPGKSPLQALTQALGQSPQVPDAAVAHALKAMPDARRLLLIVDQFEETFTFAAPEDNEPFQTVLQRLAEVPGAFVVLTARADFYDKLMAPPRVLWEQIRTHRVEVLSLDNKRLAQAIVEPARVRGVYIDPLLVQRLLADAALEPGVLPLVQETMVLMWERLERRYLSLRDYESLVPPRDRIEENGGLPHTGLQAAIERHAGLVVGGMPEPQRVIARRVFLRLIEFGQGRSDVRRQLHLEELRSRDDDPREFESTLRTLDENRLLTFSGDETSGRLVDIAHETLIASWPELRRWIATRREAELKRRRLRARATDWDALKRAGGLLDAQELPEAEHWRDGPDAAELGVDALVADFIRASREVIDRDAREKEGVRERELKAAQDLANERELTIRAQRKAMENAAEILIESGSTALLHGNSLDAMHLFASAIETMPGSSLDQVTMRQCLGFLVREVPRVDAIVEHTERVNSAAFSPEGSRIVTASGDKTARVWGADSGALLAELKGHTNAVVSGAFSPDGTSIVTASGDKTARVWNAVDGKLIAELKGHTGPVNSAAFSPDGTQIVTASADQTARVWNAADGKLIAELKGHVNWVNSAAFSPDGTRVVTASTDQTARIWNAADGKPIAELNEHTGDVYSAAFSPDGTRVVTASDDDTARVWNAADGALIAELKGHVNWVNSAAFSPDGTRVVTASTDQTARIWNAADGALIAELEGHTGPVNSAAFSPDGTRVVTASADQTARVWNATDGKLIAELIGHTDTVDSAAFSPDGTQIVTASDDDTARVWNAADGSRSAELIKGDTYKVWSAAFSPDGTRVVTASDDDTARVWNAAGGKPIVELKGHADPVYSAAFSFDGTRIVTASHDKTARVWNAADGSLIAKLEGHTDQVWSAAFSPDGTRVVTASHDKTARVWNAADGAPIVELGHADQVWSAAFSPDGTQIVTASSDREARVWNAADGALIAKLKGHANWVYSAAFSPDGTRVVTASVDQTARVWNAADGALIAKLKGHTDWVNSAAFSPDGTQIVTASIDQTARVWNAADGAFIAELKGHTDWVNSATFSPDGTRVLTASSDTTVRVWRFDAISGDASILSLWIEVLTGTELKGGGVQPLSLDAWNRRKTALQAQRDKAPPEDWFKTPKRTTSNAPASAK